MSKEADIYGQENLAGRGGWTWYTGSSSWMYELGIHYILGLTIENEFLSINPCISNEWGEYEIQYKYKATNYHIKIKNPNSKCNGVETMIFDEIDTYDFDLKKLILHLMKQLLLVLLQQSTALLLS